MTIVKEYENRNSMVVGCELDHYQELREQAREPKQPRCLGQVLMACECLSRYSHGCLVFGCQKEGNWNGHLGHCLPFVLDLRSSAPVAVALRQLRLVCRQWPLHLSVELRETDHHGPFQILHLVEQRQRGAVSQTLLWEQMA
jgi:hypothetical protein